MLSLYHRNAEILDEHLKDRAGAIAAYERVLALSPSYLPALKALGRLYAQEGRWEQLIKMYRAEAEISPSTEQAAALIFKIGELYEHRLKGENEAMAAYQEALTLAPSYFPALRALARIYRAHGAWEKPHRGAARRGRQPHDPVERANALFQAAAIWEDQLQRPELAIEGYQEVLRLTPGHAAALRALERLYAAQDNTKELVAILDRETQVGQTPGAKVAAYLKLARLYLDRFQEPARAAQCCEAVLAAGGRQLHRPEDCWSASAPGTGRAAPSCAAASPSACRRRACAPRCACPPPPTRTRAPPRRPRSRSTSAPSRRTPRTCALAFALERALRHAGDAGAWPSSTPAASQVVTEPIGARGAACCAAPSWPSTAE